jgi:hypothetical protein
MDGITLADLEEYAKVRAHIDSFLLPLPWQEWYREVLAEMLEEETHDFRWLKFALLYKPVHVIRYVRTRYRSSW